MFVNRFYTNRRDQLFDDDYAVENEKEVKMTISKKAAASTLVCVAIALLLSCSAQPAFATMPNCKSLGAIRKPIPMGELRLPIKLE